MIALFLVVALLVMSAFGALGAWVAGQKNRDGVEGFILGFLFGVLGVLVEAVLPTPGQKQNRQQRDPRDYDVIGVDYGEAAHSPQHPLLCSGCKTYNVADARYCAQCGSYDLVSS